MDKILTTEHVFIPGRTGSGKTFLARQYLAAFNNVIALDTKATLKWAEIPDVKVFTKLKDLMKFKEGKAIYRPCFEELNKEYYEAFFKWIYFRQNTICWVDEIMSICENASYIPEYMKAIYTRGRERNTSIWGLTQRPKTIPLVCMSEATHFFIFDLNLEADRRRVAEVVGNEKIMVRPPEKYSFWYFNVNMDYPVLAKL
jgi:MoxR-like ATPase